MNRLDTVKRFHAWRKTLNESIDESRRRLLVCDGTGCRALGSRKILLSLQDEINRTKLDASIEVVGTGCPGFCECGPLITIYPQRVSYQRVTLEDVPEIVEKSLVGTEVIERLLYHDPQTGASIKHEPDLPFYEKQERIVLDFNGRMDPHSLEEYVSLGGYTALAQVLNGMSPDQVIEEIKTAGLRGRGGAGFPTAIKWRLC
ncbi:MAG: NAD(P)H-dependent oxidoreductase subunit E, partial [Anaerolineales bacterium]